MIIELEAEKSVVSIQLPEPLDDDVQFVRYRGALYRRTRRAWAAWHEGDPLGSRIAGIEQTAQQTTITYELVRNGTATHSPDVRPGEAIGERPGDCSE